MCMMFCKWEWLICVVVVAGMLKMDVFGYERGWVGEMLSEESVIIVVGRCVGG